MAPKEREMKGKPRLFAIMTLIAKLYFVVTESLLGDHLLKYFPQIAMGLDGIELNKRLLDITNTQRYVTDSAFREAIAINIDSEQWNL